MIAVTTLWPVGSKSVRSGPNSRSLRRPALVLQHKRPIPEAPTPSTDRMADRNPFAMSLAPEEFFLRNQSICAESRVNDEFGCSASGPEPIACVLAKFPWLIASDTLSRLFM